MLALLTGGRTRVSSRPPGHHLCIRHHLVPGSQIINYTNLILQYYTIIDYIHVSRKTSEKLMSYLEIDFYLTDEFIETDYPELYIQANRKFHENGLILHIFDNFHKIDSPPHRRMMFYFMNILYFDL